MRPSLSRLTWAELRPGDHLCCLYETEEEHRAVVLPFLRQGLQRGEKVIYLVDAHTAETILGYLHAAGVAVASPLESGQLRILARDDTCLRAGVFDPEGMTTLVRAEAERARAEGYPALRVSGEMTWALRGLPGSERLIEYEAKLNDLLPDSPCLAACQYDRRRFDPAVLLDVLHTHPRVVIGTEIYDNPDYVPPAAFLENRPSARLQRWVQALAARKAAEGELRRADRALRVLSVCSQALLRATDESALLGEICRIAVEIGGYRLAWVGYAEQDARMTVRPVAQAGYEEGYLETLRITWADTERGQGPTGTAIRTGAPAIARDIQADPRFAPWRPEAAKRGYASSIALPLTAEGRVLGALNIYAAEPDAFNPEEVELLGRLADDLAFGIATVRTRAERTRTEVALAERTRHLEAVRRVAEEITRELDLPTLLALISRRGAELVAAESGVVFLWDEGAQVLVPRAWHQVGDWLANVRLRLGEAVAGATAQRRAGMLVNGLRTSPYADPVFLEGGGITAVLAEPLLYGDRLLGVITVGHQAAGQSFTEENRRILSLFAVQAAIAIENARLYKELGLSARQLEARVKERTQELQDAMRRLQETSRHKSEFLANMSHELRTPLNSIIGFADLLRGKSVGPLAERQARYLGHIHDAGKHLLALINDILDLTKVEAGKFVLQPETLPVRTTLEDTLIIGRELAKKKAQTVEADIEAELPALRADPIRFKQILFNLLSNAVKFTPDEGEIRLVARRSSAASTLLEIRVTDSGVGIQAEDLPRLFQEFVQLETTRSQTHEGAGLGLALTKRLVELHGGRIWAESEGEGRGSTFTVLLPFGGPPASESPWSEGGQT